MSSRAVRDPVRMRVLLLLPYAWDTAPSQRYRIEQWSPHLRSRGVELIPSTLLEAREQKLLYSPGQVGRKASVLLRAMAKRLREVRRVRGVDAVWLHRAAWPIGPPLPERLLARQRVPVVYEFDDAIFLNHTSAANERWKSLKWAGKTGEICALSRQVVVGNEYLANYARRFNPRVTVVPTSIDTDGYRPPATRPAGGPVTLGWSGSITTLAHLRTLEGVLAQVARAVPVQLRVVGVTGYAMPGIPTTAIEWRPDRQVAELGGFDIGLMPLPDEEWARGKCACKALEYMAVETPTVTSPVGVNAQIVRDGLNGMLAQSDRDWYDRLLRLAGDPELRRELGVAGRRTVEAEFSTRVVAPRAFDVLCETVGIPGAPVEAEPLVGTAGG